jgi:hypothetical protein
MQIASFILIRDHALRLLEEQLDLTLQQVASPNAVFLQLLPAQLQEAGTEHPISIPFSTLYPLDQAAERQHERVLSVFEDPLHPSRLRRMAQDANAPIYYVSPARVRAFERELETLRLAHEIHPEDVKGLLGRQVANDGMPQVITLLEQFRHDLYTVYHDAAEQGMGVVVLVLNQPDEMTSESEFPRAA